MDNCELSHFHHGMMKAWQFMTMIEYSQTWMVKNNITLDIFRLFFPSLGIWDKSQLSNIGFIPIMEYSWLVVWNIFYFSIYWEWSSQLTFIFFRGIETTNQIPFMAFSMFSLPDSRCSNLWGVEVARLGVGGDDWANLGFNGLLEQMGTILIPSGELT